MTPPPRPSALRQFRVHPRDWRSNRYVYPVLSRRSGGVSIGINLNPDTACNFDCIYCQVDRSRTPLVRDVDLPVLRRELEDMLQTVLSGDIFREPTFADVPEPLRQLCDIAFSGDGEPTTCPLFADAVAVTAECKRLAGLDRVRLVLITDAAYLTRPAVQHGLAVMDANQGEVWAKLDAGTEAYYQRVNRPNVSLGHIINEITACSRQRSIVIQSLFMRIDGIGPDDAEIVAYTEQLSGIVAAGGRIDRVQVYTVARKPAEAAVTPLSDSEVDHIAAVVRQRTSLVTAAYYGPSDL